MDVVYKIMTPSEWAETCKVGEFTGSTVDQNDGYIHFSTSDQVEQTVIRHFADSNLLVLVAVTVQSVGINLRFEPSRGGALFPHLYAKLKAEDVLWSKEFESARLDDLRRLLTD